MPVFISIVEDQTVIRNGLMAILSMSPDFQLLECHESAESLLEWLPKSIRKPDIILQDIGLPGMNGLECLLQIKKEHPSIKVMIFTVFDNDNNVFEALRQGADGYILKKESPEKIMDALRDLQEGGAPMSREVARKVMDSFKTASSPGNVTDLLSNREYEILQHLAKGYLYKEIADNLAISISTVKQHIHHIYEKLQVQNRSEAILRYLGQ
jgi:DNA-binding NarL/FixJ family response regulator